MAFWFVCLGSANAPQQRGLACGDPFPPSTPDKWRFWMRLGKPLRLFLALWIFLWQAGMSFASASLYALIGERGSKLF